MSNEPSKQEVEDRNRRYLWKELIQLDGKTLGTHDVAVTSSGVGFWSKTMPNPKVFHVRNKDFIVMVERFLDKIGG